MAKSHILKLAAAAVALSFPLAASAGESAKNAVVEEIAKSCITGDLGVSFVSEYIYRGVALENQGAIAQPYLDLYFSLYKGDGFVNSVSLNLGLWSSLHSHQNHWYEFDASAGIAVGLAKNFTLTTSFVTLASPADAFLTAYTVDVRLGYDDTDLLGAFALHPHALVSFDVNGTNALLSGDGSGDGIYYELGVAPSVTLVKDGAYPVTLTLPVNVGLGNANTYAGDSFGYVSAGANVAVGLGFVPACYGIWTANAGVTYYHLGNQARANSQGTEENHVVFSGGIGMTF